MLPQPDGKIPMSKLLYFRQRHDADRIMATVAEIAANLGYVNAGGPNPGVGNVAELLAAIANGEIAVVKLDDKQRAMVLGWFETRLLLPPLEEALDKIAVGLHEAHVRSIKTNEKAQTVLRSFAS